MPFEAVCEYCGHRLQTAHSVVGRKVRCKKCRTAFVVTAAITRPAPLHPKGIALPNQHSGTTARVRRLVFMVAGGVMIPLLGIAVVTWPRDPVPVTPPSGPVPRHPMAFNDVGNFVVTIAVLVAIPFLVFSVIAAICRERRSQQVAQTRIGVREDTESSGLDGPVA